MNSWKVRVYSVLLTLLIFLTGCSLPGSDDNLIRYNISVNVDNLDPQYISTANETLLILNCFEGLMKLDASGQPIAALAERYTLSEDKQVYTFYLREGLKWSDGEPLTAGDFVFAFRRLFNPDSPSPNARDFRSMENADAILSGQLAASRLGIRALDSRTLEQLHTLEQEEDSIRFSMFFALLFPGTAGHPGGDALPGGFFSQLQRALRPFFKVFALQRPLCYDYLEKRPVHRTPSQRGIL